MQAGTSRVTDQGLRLSTLKLTSRATAAGRRRTRAVIASMVVAGLVAADAAGAVVGGEPISPESAPWYAAYTT